MKSTPTKTQAKLTESKQFTYAFFWRLAWMKSGPSQSIHDAHGTCWDSENHKTLHSTKTYDIHNCLDQLMLKRKKKYCQSLVNLVACCSYTFFLKSLFTAAVIIAVLALGKSQLVLRWPCVVDRMLKSKEVMVVISLGYSWCNPYTEKGQRKKKLKLKH